MDSDCMGNAQRHLQTGRYVEGGRGDGAVVWDVEVVIARGPGRRYHLGTG